MKRILLTTIGLALALGGLALVAEETTTEKIIDKGDEAVKDAKQEGRKLKKKIRDKSGNSSLKEDLEDTAENAKDELQYQGRKAKRKVD